MELKLWIARDEAVIPEDMQHYIERHPEDPIRLAIKGMLPNGRLGRAIMDNVKIYAGAEHPHAAQNPKALEV